MKILDATGKALEDQIYENKIKMVLSGSFIEDVKTSNDDELVDYYNSAFGIRLYSHDFDRARYINTLYGLHVVDPLNNGHFPVRFFNDTLTVIYEWLGRFGPVYGMRGREEAYDVFRLLCNANMCYSVLNLSDEDCSTMFNFIYSRDFIEDKFTLNVI